MIPSKYPKRSTKIQNTTISSRNIIELGDYSFSCEGTRTKITNTLFVIQLLVGMKIGKLCKYFGKVESHFLCWWIWFISSERSGPVGFKLAGEFPTCHWLCDSLLVGRSNLWFHLFDLRIRNLLAVEKWEKVHGIHLHRMILLTRLLAIVRCKAGKIVWNVHQIMENMN